MIESKYAPPTVHRPEDDAQEGWDLLREMRGLADEHGITQKELGRRLGISQSRISALENSTRGPTYAFLKRVARACGLNLEVRVYSVKSQEMFVEDEENLRLKQSY